ncbi:MAG: cell division protein ZapA [Spirochaetaceae bacterium]|nr:cell division protein ZapA [Spirochaetaceae bacterium]
MAEHLTHVELLGTSFTIRSEEDPAYLNEVMTYYRERLEATAALVSWSDPLKVSIVAALNVVDELFKERMINGTVTEEARKTGEVASRLIGQIDRALNPPQDVAARDPAPPVPGAAPEAAPRSEPSGPTDGP